MNFGMIFYTLGWVLKIEAISMAFPMIVGMIYNEQNSVASFLIAILVCFAAGLLLSFKAPKNKSMYAKEGFVTVAFSWVAMSIFGSFPFIISGSIPSFIDAFFETVSGFTTTGASILTDVNILSKALLMWRSLTHWIGGMGVLVFLMAILPLSGSGNLHLLRAESPGPSVGKLVPRVKSTAKLLYTIYIALTGVQIVLMMCGGMNWFDSVALSFGTAGTGGFAILNSSIAGYSPYIQYVITIFMIIFGIDFSLYHSLLFREKKSFFKSEELRVYLGVIILATVLIFFNSKHMFATSEEAIRHVSFSVGSVITTTGYATTDYNLWPEFSRSIIVLLMFLGACAGSTGGGIKISRILILLKSIVKEVKTTAHPRATVKLKMNGRAVEHETVRGVNVFMAAYICIFVFSFLIISFDNFDFTTNFTAVAATINNVGPGLGVVGPTGNFAGFSGLSKVVMSFCMLVGRLEIFPLLLLFSPYTWRK